MNWFNILYYAVAIIFTIITTFVPTFIAYEKNSKARKAAETDVAEEKANTDLLANAKNFIAAAEVAFDGFDRMMKQQGGSAGAMKKDTVFTKLQAYALQHGYKFDNEEWSAKIDELVKFTKEVNSTNKTNI